MRWRWGLDSIWGVEKEENAEEPEDAEVSQRWSQRMRRFRRGGASMSFEF